MIRSKKELKFYIMADMMMNRGVFKWSLKDRIKQVFFPDYVMIYLKAMRFRDYLSNNNHTTPPYRSLCHFLYILFWHKKYSKLGLRLGFSIDYNSLGYGVVIPHYGTIVVGPNNIGNFAVLQTSTCISGNGKTIGDALYLATGAKITSKVTIGDNVSICANSIVNKDVQPNVLIGGSPAKIIKMAEPWYIRDGEEYANRVSRVEDLKKSMNI